MHSSGPWDGYQFACYGQVVISLVTLSMLGGWIIPDCLKSQLFLLGYTTTAGKLKNQGNAFYHFFLSLIIIIE